MGSDRVSTQIKPENNLTKEQVQERLLCILRQAAQSDIRRLIRDVMILVPTILAGKIFDSLESWPYLSIIFFVTGLMRSCANDVRRVLKDVRSNIWSVTDQVLTDEAVLERNKLILDKLRSPDATLIHPYLITIFSAASLAIAYLGKPNSNSDILFSVGMIIAYVAMVETFQLERMRSRVRTELQKLLPYIQHGGEITATTGVRVEYTDNLAAKASESQNIVHARAVSFQKKA